jgi:hypothetical protein
MKIMSIDVGWVNLAIVLASVDNTTWEFQTLFSAHLVNLNELQHLKIPVSQCTLHHTNDACDKINHFIQEYQDDWMNQADLIVIERQPITGLVHVEQLLYSKYRNKTILISPNKMHRWLNIQHLSYEKRKEKTTMFAESKLEQDEQWIQACTRLHENKQRLHDIADAVCILLYFLSLKQEELKQYKKIHQPNINLENKSVYEYLQQFKFIQ